MSEAEETASVGVDPELEPLVAWLRDKLDFPGWSAASWGAEHDAIAVDFLSHPDARRLFATVSDGVLTLTASGGPVVDLGAARVMYFVRQEGVELGADNIQSAVSYGSLSGAPMVALLRSMSSVYAPQVLAKTNWPESVQKDFTGHLHRFMASLTETTHQLQGKTVLYIPDEALDDIEAAAGDKDLVQRLESTVIHWTKQIKDVVNNQDNAHNSEAAGPLEEISFWRSRTLDLSGISDQLNRAGVRRIVAVLEAAKSSYLGPFETLSNRIQEGSSEANDNLRFLSSLTQPCEALAQAGPSDIPGILPGLLNCIRMIWSTSRHYNTEERLTGLLRKVSNEIIARCCAHISLTEIFDGDVQGSMGTLLESIECGKVWKVHYQKTADAIERATNNTSRHWNFDEASIFAQVDAFVQRCRELQEVCQGQIQFARKGSVEAQGPGPASLPAFGGTRGPETTKALLDIEAAFEAHIDKLRNLRYDILDVKASNWHEDFNHFKNGVKDLEVMMVNVINTAFENVATVPDGVALLEAFYTLANRTAIQRCVERQTANVFQLFIAQVVALRADFDTWRRAPPLRYNEPQHAGAALWARSLAMVAHESWRLLEEAHYLVRVREADDAEAAYNGLIQVLDDYRAQKNQAWSKELSQMDSTTLAARLETPLMRRVGAEESASQAIVRTEPGHLESNFDKQLLSLFSEVLYWEKFQGELSIPYIAHDICNQKEKLRVLREYAMLVVRDYNAILGELSAEERRLFTDHIRRLDKRINQGLTKLTWGSKGIVDWYVKDCRKHCEDLHHIVRHFKAGKETLGRNCRAIASTGLIKIEKNYVYDEGVFEAKQAEHRQFVKRKLEQAHASIKSTMKEMYSNFKDSADVQREWRSFTLQTDRKVETALRQTVKRSLQELSRAINGDAKTDPQTLFKVNVVLENNRVEFRPTMINLTQIVNIVSKELISTISVVPRLKELLAAEAAAEARAEARGAETVEEVDVASLPRFYDDIANDDDTLKILVQIMNGMSSSATELQRYLSYWDKYKPIWEMDKEAFIRRYAKASRPLVQYDIDITRYKEQQADIQREDISNTINFIKIDCTLLKSSLVNHCVQWQNKLTGLLNQNALVELEALHRLMDDNTERLRTPPLGLDQLSESISLLRQQQTDAPAVEQKFEPLEAMYQTLARFEVQISDGEVQMLASLREKWEEFGIMLVEVEKMLDRSKVNMKRDLEDALASFSNHVQELRKEAVGMLPYSSDSTPDRAFQHIEEVRQKVTATRERERALAPGLEIFPDIVTEEYKEVRDTERELDLLQQVWTLTDDWNGEWNTWKTGLFRDLDVEEMENTAGQFIKKVGKLGREMKKWKVWEALKEKVEQFRQTMPLIQDLKNPAMRARHWQLLMAEISREFDPNANDFTLERVFSLGLHLHVDFIGELSSNANKELNIETALADIEARWAEIDIDVVPYKTEYHKIRSTDDLFQALEDDQVSLSTMKASKFYASFADKINRWEAALSHVSEVVDLILTVQRQWMYLESIFMASEDIRKQLPTETSLFDQVNDAYKFMMERTFNDPNANRACHVDGMLEMVQDMDQKLETIQKSLDQYLETKRMIFPRFYFLSNDDLLEILGQSRDPSQVQKHIKKCFEGIKTLQLIAPGKQLNRTYEAAGMVAPDKEEIPFVQNVIVDGAVELWLVEVEKMMVLTLQKLLGLSLQAFRGKKEKWIREWAGQLLITTGQIAWTNDCQRALGEIAKGNKNALRQLKKKQVGYLNRLTDMVRSQLTKIERSKLVALITMEIHSRDVMERMIKAGCSNVTDFEWLSQLRFVFAKDEGQYGICSVRQTNAILEYTYEYQGNNGRLVVTPLTDRCVLTLTTALFLHRGGNPLGPAGTGKTETVKDLGKNLGKYVVVTNCSDALDYKSVGRMFAGLVQCGAWGCFDEFNRIEIEVLSVVAMQILSIVNALSQKAESFLFMGQNIRCNPNTGIFITMNPGYAGRTELPDNLKALMRPVAMMTPDLSLIAEVMLQAEGFREARALAKKTVTLYNLMVQQLSKQDHYDYGLRNLKAVLNCAGALKRGDPEMNEEAILMRALRDMNMPKFIKDDMRLFRLLLGDLFPSLELPVTQYGPLQVAIEGELEAAGHQKHPYLISKTVQLFESKATRHCNMLVGSTLAGKSTTWRTLAAAKTRLATDGEEGFQPVTFIIINPKSVSLNELYGAYDLATFEWSDGVLSTVFRNCAQDDRPVEKWIMFDGPVDTLWIESMNSTMDDNKVLTLINSDRIAMTPTMSLLFEVENLSVASPATVSRAGMVYIDVEELGYQPYVASWLQRKFADDQEALEFHQGLFEKYVDPLLQFKLLTDSVVEPVPITDFNGVQSLCTLYDCLATVDNGVDRGEAANAYFAMAEKWFVFCTIWSVLAAADESSRRQLDVALRDIEAQFPPLNTVYDYCVDPKKRDWEPWESKVPAWRPRNLPFYKMIVPNVDTVRNKFVVKALVAHNKNTLVVGNTGTGKTVLVNDVLSSLPETHSSLTVNFSAATTSNTTQTIIELSMEKRAKDKMGPAGGKRLVTFVDDLNMPKKDTFGSQPALELLRQWVDYGGWYDRAKCAWRYILDMQLVCAMAPPSGGRAVISERTQSRFNLLNVTFPSDSQVCRIFESILGPKLVDFDDEVKPLAPALSAATLQVYKAVQEQFLPTPVKSHYLFNLRDVSKVIQGVVLADRNYFDTKDSMLRLWVHECNRVFSDRFVQDAANDEERFTIILADKTRAVFDMDYYDLMSGVVQEGLIFTDFLREPVGDREPSYEEVDDFAQLKQFLEERLEDYNLEPKLLNMDLVLFRDAIHHVCRIHRVLRQPRGNAMLVGVGGSGRQSLSNLASFVAGYSVFQIEITKQYRSVEFHEDLKKLYLLAGVEGKPTTFLFSDTQLKEESFLEDINNILSSGEVPNLFGKDELPALFDDLRPAARAADPPVPDMAQTLWAFFIERVRKNLHVIITMSPVGDALRNRCRMYPGLVSCTTIDWFHAWPGDALLEVGLKFLANTRLESDLHRQAVAEVFSVAQQSVATASEKMFNELKRHNYVTPTNYLELVKGYTQLLYEKRSELGDSRDKLRNGLSKLEESRKQVETMSVELEVKKETVAQSQKDCEDLLVVIVSERRVADEQRKQVEADSERIGREEEECKHIAADAEADLNVALPALERAMREVDKLDKSAISEVKAYAKPPKPVENVMGAVMVLFGLQTDWATSKKKISEPDFLRQVKGYDKDNVSNSLLAKVKKFVNQPDFTPEDVAKVSAAAAALCTWVCAIHLYANVFRDVAPKRARLKSAMDTLRVKQAGLKQAQEKLAEVVEKVEQLKNQYEESVDEKNRLRKEAEDLELKLTRADKLVNGLAGEYDRWQASIGGFESSIANLVGDALVAAAFLSYAGPFDTVYRADLVHLWLHEVKERELPFTEGFNFADFLARPTDVRDWNIQGLPKDNFSTENGVIVTRGNRWPLMIDPQGQANKWVKNMEGEQLKIIDLKMKDFLRDVENAIQFGMPVLLQDVLEELDPSLDPVLGKNIQKVGNREIIRLGDKELDYSHDFRFYITTKMGNPHYTPEVTTKTTVVNFAVKQQGLEAQLLGIVVQKEESKLEMQKSDLTVRVAAGKRKLVDLENEILKLLAESTGSLLDDENLVNTLQQSKVISEEVTQQLAVAEETEQMIDTAREGYRAAAVRASILYFVLDDLARVDPMYQFSLDSYVDLFELSIDNSRANYTQDGDRNKAINTEHTFAVYAYTCRGLFERHKLLFSFQMCVRILQSEGKVPQQEYDFFLYGGVVLDRTEQRPNPCVDWLEEQYWDNITELDKVPGFLGLASSFEQTSREWRTWYLAPKPEDEPLPGDWDNKCNELQQMMILRSLRPDRVLFAATRFVSNNMGPQFAEPPAFDLPGIVDSSNPRTPLIFILSPGVDPTAQVAELARARGVRLGQCALGQGQAPVAVSLLEEGLEQGNWVFLANCHLMLSWMPVLEKTIENYCNDAQNPPHPEFRLWLSSSPHPQFPISILQRGIKVTTEPPKGLRANMLRLYNLVSDDQFNMCGQQFKYRKLLFALCWFHSVLLERRKFKSLGWNIPYEFNESDFSICHDLLIVLLDEYPERTPWQALRYLIAEANYGGRVTDDRDRLLVNTYIDQFMCEDSITAHNYPLSELHEYFIPPDSDLEGYKSYIKTLPTTDHPAAMGQHSNADIASLLGDTKDLLTTIISLQPRVVVEGAESDDAVVLRQAQALLEQVPDQFDVRAVKNAFQARSDPDPLKTVLFQELERYNKLLKAVRSMLVDVQRAVQGLVVINAELEEVSSALLTGAVPSAWGFAYPSLKPLGSWMRDLVLRAEFFKRWVDEQLPRVFWLGAFTYPSGFLTALLQTSARKNGVAIDAINFDFAILNQDEHTVSSSPKEGAFVRGVFIEGARWNHDLGTLAEPLPLELYSPMPLIHFKPVEQKKRAAKGTYAAPLYLYPVRTGTRERPSFIINVELKSGQSTDYSYWVKRGTALLLSLA